MKKFEIALLLLAAWLPAESLNVFLQREYLLMEQPLSSMSHLKDLERSDLPKFGVFQFAQISSRQWPSSTPSPVFLVWCPADSVDLAVARIRYVLRGAEKNTSNNLFDFLILDAEPKSSKKLWVDSKAALIGTSISAGSFSMFGTEPDDIALPMPSKPVLLVLEQVAVSNDRYDFYIYRADVDWEKALSSMALTPCWIQDKGPFRQVDCQQGELVGKRGQLMTFLAYVAPGGRIFYGANTAEMSYEEKSLGLSGRHWFTWGHGAVPIEKITNDYIFVGSVLLRNCIFTKGRLLGVHHAYLNEENDGKLRISSPTVSNLEEKVIELSPLPSR